MEYYVFVFALKAISVVKVELCAIIDRCDCSSKREDLCERGYRQALYTPEILP